MEKLIFLCSDLLQPDFLIHKIIQDVFVKLGNRNSYDESISLIADIDETKFKLGTPNRTNGSVFYNSKIKTCFIGKIFKFLSDF